MLLSSSYCQSSELIHLNCLDLAYFANRYVELENVTIISVGCTDNILTCQLWLLGKLAWFEIRPDLAYREIHEDMMKAISLKFFVDDWYYGSLERQGTKKYDTDDDEIHGILLEVS